MIKNDLHIVKKNLTTEIGADEFYEMLKNNPEKIIAWAEREIREYKKLIKLLKEGVK